MVKRFVSIFPEKFSQKPVLSGWLQISNTGFNSVETGTGPVAPLPGSLMCGSGIRIFLFFSITGIHAGAGDCLAMIVCCILLLFKL